MKREDNQRIFDKLKAPPDGGAFALKFFGVAFSLSGTYSAPGTWMTPMGHSFTQI